MKRIKYFRNPETGLIFEYTDVLAKRNDLVPIFDNEKVEEEPEQIEETNHKCPYCGRYFKNAGGLNLHLQFCDKKPEEEAEQNIEEDVVV